MYLFYVNVLFQYIMVYYVTQFVLMLLLILLVFMQNMSDVERQSRLKYSE